MNGGGGGSNATSARPLPRIGDDGTGAFFVVGASVFQRQAGRTETFGRFQTTGVVCFRPKGGRPISARIHELTFLRVLRELGFERVRGYRGAGEWW